MSDWTYPVTDFLTGKLVCDDIPLQVEYFDDALGVGTGTLSGSLPYICDSDVEGSLPVPLDHILLGWRRVIWPCWRGRPFGAYVVLAEAPFGADPTQPQVAKFTAARVDVILKWRRIWSTLVFTQQDQLDIARDLVSFGLGRALTHQAAGYPQPATSELPTQYANSPWLLLDTATSGVLRDRLDDDDGYQRARDLTVADALGSLAALQNGFETRLDYSTVTPAFTGDSGLRATIRLGYPNLGHTYPVMPLTYPNGNVTDWTYGWDEDGTETMARLFGAGQGAERAIGGIATNATLLGQEYPLLMGSQSSTASQSSTLLANAQARISDRVPNVGWTFSLTEDQLGRYELGDVLDYSIHHPRWPGGKRGYVRVTGHRVVPTQPGRVGKVVPLVVDIP